MTVDINAAWEKPGDPELLFDDACMRQAIFNILFYSKDEIVNGNGNEIDLKSRNFELIHHGNSSLTVQAIADAIAEADNRFELVTDESYVRAVGDQYQLYLTIKYDYDKTFVIDQLIDVN